MSTSIAVIKVLAIFLFCFSSNIMIYGSRENLDNEEFEETEKLLMSPCATPKVENTLLTSKIVIRSQNRYSVRKLQLFYLYNH